MGKFVISPGKSGGFHFNLKAGNGEIILTSEHYHSLEACRKGIESVRKNAPIAKIEDQTLLNFSKVTNPKFELYDDKAGECRFRLMAHNGENIGASQGYTEKSSAKEGIESVRKNAPEAALIQEEA